MTAWAAAVRYEWCMQLRRPAMWLVALLLIMLTVILGGVGHALAGADPRIAAVQLALQCVVELPIGVAFAMSDRALRDRQLHLRDQLDATPGGAFARLAGKYVGGVAAATVPLAAFYLGTGAAWAAGHRSPAGLSWWAAGFAAVILPGTLMIGAVSLCLPLIVPQAVFRTVVVGFWLWAGWLLPPRSVAGLGETVLSPAGGYPIAVFFHYRGAHAGAPAWAGPVPGAPLNWLRPEPSPATATLQIGCLLAIALITLAVTHLARTRPAR